MLTVESTREELLAFIKDQQRLLNDYAEHSNKLMSQIDRLFALIESMRAEYREPA